MSSKNVIGYVVEVIQERGKVFLKVRLKSTLGKEKDFLIEGPKELEDFFDPEMI